MNGSQQIAAALGGGLIAANFWTSGRHAFAGGALTAGAGAHAQQQAHDQVRNVALELLGVGIVVLLAGVNARAAGAVIAALIALWIVWLIKYNSPKQGGQ